jgi:hypothetical protein
VSRHDTIPPGAEEPTPPETLPEPSAPTQGLYDLPPLLVPADDDLHRYTGAYPDGGYPYPRHPERTELTAAQKERLRRILCPEEDGQ